MFKTRTINVLGLAGTGTRLLKVVLDVLFLLASQAVLFPTNFKRAKLIPLHKRDSLYDRNNYRPISILPIVSKRLERHVS